MDQFIIHRLHCYYNNRHSKVSCQQKRLMQSFVTPTQKIKGNLFLQTLRANKKTDSRYKRQY